MASIWYEAVNASLTFDVPVRRRKFIVDQAERKHTSHIEASSLALERCLEIPSICGRHGA